MTRPARRYPDGLTVTLDWEGNMVVERDETHDMSFPVECSRCYSVYDMGKVEVLARYADCSTWRAPCCGHPCDSRTSWGGPSWRKMGYVDLGERRREQGRDRR